MKFWQKVLAFNVALTVVLVFLCLAAIEAYFRITLPPEPTNSIFEYSTTTKRYGVMKKNLVSTPWGEEFRTNRLGFRDSDSEVPKKGQEEFRIVVLGDSVTAAAGVAFDSIYTTRLERLLQTQYAKTTVINLGVGGYNIIQYALLLEEVAYDLEPDLILVSVLPLNDLRSATYRRSERLARQASHHPTTTTATSNDPEGEPPVPLYVYRGYLRNISFIRHIVEGEDIPNSTPDQVVSDAADNMRALGSIFESTARRKIPLVIALLPYTNPFERQRRDFEPFEQQCERNQWPCVSLLNRLVESELEPESLRLNLFDSHPDERYHDLIARALFDVLVSRVRNERAGS